MNDPKAADLARRGEVVELFRYLNPMWIVVIFQILDDLLDQALFFPNPDRFAAELGRAGINVDRMKVALAAVLHKNARKMTDQEFMRTYGALVGGLPDQAQREVKEYWNAGPKPGLVAGTAPVSGDVAKVGFDKYVDMFSECKYDMNYKVPADVSFYYSPILQLTYADGVKLELNIETDFPVPPQILTSEAGRDAMARGTIGGSQRIFPSIIASRTVPRLYRARTEALRIQNEDFGKFASVAVTGVAFVLSVPAMPAGAAAEVAGATTVARRRVPGVTTASVADQIASKLPGGAQIVTKGRGHVIYRTAGGQARIRFDARGAKTLQAANPGRNHTVDNLAGVNQEGEVFVHEGRHRAIGAAKGDIITPDNGGIPGNSHLLDFEFSDGVAQSGGVYVRELNIDYTVPDVGAAEAEKLWRAKHGL